MIVAKSKSRAPVQRQPPSGQGSSKGGKGPSKSGNPQDAFGKARREVANPPSNNGSKHNGSSTQRQDAHAKDASKKSGRAEDPKGDSAGHRKNHFGKTRPDQKCPACKQREYLEKILGVRPLTFTGRASRDARTAGTDADATRPTAAQTARSRFPVKCVPITAPVKPVLSGSTIDGVIADLSALTLFDKSGTGRLSFPIMQCGTLEVPDSYQRPSRMDAFQIDDGFHSDDETDTPPPSPSSASSIASTSDHGSLESVDAGGAQRLAVLSFEQVRKLNDVMNETVAIHGSGNFPTLEVTLKDLVTLVRKKLETDVQSGGAGMVVKDIRLNGGAASHVLASEAQPYNDVDFIFAVEFSTSRHFDRVKNAVLSVLCDLLPEGVSRRRITPCALKDAYVGKMVKVNLNSDGDKWSLISLGNSPGHKNVELKFVDTMRRQFEFSVDSFQIVLDSLLLFYDCAALPISENFYPTVVGESVYGDFQEALYHLQKKLISTRQPEEIRGGGLLKYCNLLVRNYKPVDPEKIKTQERYMCSRFFIDFPDVSTQEVKLDAYLRNHFWGPDEEPLQYQYLMHLREVVETSTVCLMGHERRQTLLLIQSLAVEVLCRGQQKQQQQQHAQQQSQQITQQQQQQTQQSQQQPAAQQPNQSQAQQSTTTTQQIHIQTPPGYIYANGVYYAPVIPTTTICTCNSTWLST